MDRGIDEASKHIQMGPPARPCDYLFLLRPIILIPVWTFFLLGAYHGSSAADTPIRVGSFFAGLFSFTALIGAVYIINQIADRESDLVNRKLFFLPHGIISARAAWIEASLLTLASLTIGYLLVSPLFAFILAVSLALGAAYSLEPVRFKKRPVLDVLSNAAGNGILNTLAGWIAAGAALSNLITLLPYPLAVASVHLTTTLADIEGDSRLGFRTSGVALGRRWGLIISTALMLAAAGAAAVTDNRPAFYASVLSLPMFLIPVRSSRRNASPAGILLPAKTATLIFSITAGFLFPYYIPILALVIGATRLYYRRRFGMSYPSL
jgi:4-hydroxybenzoate polyprenyltransferase